MSKCNQKTYDIISDYDFARIREGLVVVAVVETNFKVKLQPKLNKKSQTKEIIHWETLWTQTSTILWLRNCIFKHEFSRYVFPNRILK